MYISVFGWFVFVFCLFAIYIIIDKVILDHFRNKDIASAPEKEFGSQKWLIMWVVIITLAVAWNPVGLKIGSWLWIQLGGLYHQAEAAINAPVGATTVSAAPPSTLSATGSTTPSALVPVVAIDKNMWTIASDGLIKFSPPPSGWKWMIRPNSGSPPFEPPQGFALLGTANAEVYLQSTTDASKVSTALWLK